MTRAHGGPPFIETDGETNAAYYHSCNRGKHSVSLDFQTPDGMAQLKELIASADIFIENFKVGGLAKYGLDYATLSLEFPALIYCSITGFGQTGPYAKRAGYDFLMQGMSGLMSITGEPDRQPQKVGRRRHGCLHWPIRRHRDSNGPTPPAIPRDAANTSICHCSMSQPPSPQIRR